MRLALILFFQCFLISSLFAQASNHPVARNITYTDDYRNAISIDLEWLLLVGDITINYERILINDAKNSLGAEGGVGVWGYFGNGYSEMAPLFKGSLNFYHKFRFRALTYGNFFNPTIFRNYEFEFGIGSYMSPTGLIDSNFWPLIRLGFRDIDYRIYSGAYICTAGIGLSFAFPF